MTYSGSYRHSLDAKSRVFLPARYRAGLSSGVMVMPWFGGKLQIVGTDAWSRLAEEIKQAKREGQISAAEELLIISEATEETPDTQGRIVIAQRLRDYAEIRKDLWFLGCGDRIQVLAAEIWDPRRDAVMTGMKAREDL